MAHPQSSGRGYVSFNRVDIGGAQLTNNSTGTLLVNGGVQVSGQSNGVMTALSTGVVLQAVKIGAHWLTANSTGLLIGANQVTTS